MVVVQEFLENGLLCDECGQGFCEVIEADADDIESMIQVVKGGAKGAQVGEVKQEPTLNKGGSMLSQLTA